MKMKILSSLISGTSVALWEVGMQSLFSGTIASLCL
jgi:hypothetical protein